MYLKKNPPMLKDLCKLFNYPMDDLIRTCQNNLDPDLQLWNKENPLKIDQTNNGDSLGETRRNLKKKTFIKWTVRKFWFEYMFSKGSFLVRQNLKTLKPVLCQSKTHQKTRMMKSINSFFSIVVMFCVNSLILAEFCWFWNHILENSNSKQKVHYNCSKINLKEMNWIRLNIKLSAASGGQI